MNTFGLALRVTTFGESHGEGVGCVIDGLPSGLWIDEKFIDSEMQKRAPGKSRLSTPRKESDCVRILSGIFEGKSTGTPLALWIANENQKSRDYANVAELFRPSHADWTYHHKYGNRDYRGGGRASARETAARVAAGAVAQLLLREIGITLEGGIFQIGEHKTQERDFAFAQNSEVLALDSALEETFVQRILEAKKQHDSVGGAAEIRAHSVPIGLGEPLAHKLDSELARNLMGLNGVKAVEIGDGIAASSASGSAFNDSITKSGFATNHSGGILGGISNGDTLIVRAYFKPTASIFLPQDTLNVRYEPVQCNLSGRHDPCIAVRGCVVAKSLVALTLADMALLHMRATLAGFKNFYDTIHSPFKG
ncbi:MAG: chorismate synthase [Helicobacter sp.]|nr:chorismate synthase [Helicobacter sp.]